MHQVSVWGRYMVIQQEREESVMGSGSDGQLQSAHNMCACERIQSVCIRAGQAARSNTINRTCTVALHGPFGKQPDSTNSLQLGLCHRQRIPALGCCCSRARWPRPPQRRRRAGCRCAWAALTRAAPPQAPVVYSIPSTSSAELHLPRPL